MLIYGFCQDLSELLQSLYLVCQLFPSQTYPVDFRRCSDVFRRCSDNFQTLSKGTEDILTTFKRYWPFSHRKTDKSSETDKSASEKMGHEHKFGRTSGLNLSLHLAV